MANPQKPASLAPTREPEEVSFPLQKHKYPIKIHQPKAIHNYHKIH
jgi:hypothetical protein